jgi:hypothetical protein
MKRKTIYEVVCARHDNTKYARNFRTKKGFNRFDRSSWGADCRTISVERVTKIINKGKETRDGAKWGTELDEDMLVLETEFNFLTLDCPSNADRTVPSKML